jgi:putative methyltransferase (TIGR04325 family)
MAFRQFVRNWTPPALLSLVRQLRAPKGPPDWEYCPEGWHTASPEIKGWNEPSIAAAQERTWTDFVRLASGPGPLGINHTDLVPNAENYGAHNTVISFGYALALAADGKSEVSLLDWGGGLGHYGILAQSLLRGKRIHYFCKEVPVLCAAGRKALPSGTFMETWDECRARSYDLVLVSGSLHYSVDWRQSLEELASVCDSYLLVTRLPIIHSAASYVAVQRPYGCGYQTEYLGWCINRAEFLDQAGAMGMELIRELLVDERPAIHGAPEQPEYRGFLFRPPPHP